ncbi:hypothetical protein GGR53DRAFT_125539 [Hypoxylon sp. FL1150]|nr:hypothetical protein GGR53DRAFT_125539 [Hypoxylon sp. FL1150]
MRMFELRMKQKQAASEQHRGTFVFLNNTRFDLPGMNTTILGTTLFSFPHPSLEGRVDSFYRARNASGDWNYDMHLRGFRRSVGFLQEEVKTITAQDSTRLIVIFSHHSPTQHPEALASQAAPLAWKDDHIDCFSTDMSQFAIWHHRKVVLWAFGATGHNCKYRHDELTLISNQRRTGSPDGSHNCRSFDPSLTVTFVKAK